MRKRILSLMMLLLLFWGLCLSVSAAEVPDLDRTGSISVAMTHDGRPVPGGTLTLYRVADVVLDAGYGYEYTDEFSSCTIALTELDSARLPQELARIAVLQRVNGTTQELSRQGKTKFSDLKAGLYLVVQWEAAPGYTRINPFLVSVPQNEDGSYVYDVDTAPKNIPEPELKPTKPTEPKPTKPGDDKLPQTGQNNWPVPVMACAGMLMVSIGWGLYASSRKKNHEG